MTRFIRYTRFSVLAILLALGSLSLTPSAPTTVHAATAPSITATGGTAFITVTGSGFTPGATVLVDFWDRYWNVSSSVVTALGPHTVCHSTPSGRFCYRDAGGEINFSQALALSGSIAAHAQDNYVYNKYLGGDWSNWSTTYVRAVT